MAAPSSRALLLLLLVAGATPRSEAQDWPAFRGPRGDGHAPAGLPPGEGRLAFAQRWQRPLGSGYAGIAVVGELLVTAGRAGDEDVVVALATADGSERWRASLGPTYAGHDGSHDGPIATPAVAGDQVFAVSAHGRLVALDGASGAVRWSRDLPAELKEPAPFYGHGSSPRVVGDSVVVWMGDETGKVACFDRTTGALRWKRLEEAVGAQSPVVATLAGKEQIVVIGGTSVAGLDPADGTVLWRLEHKGGSAMGAASSSPVVLGNDRIFFKHGTETTMVVQVTRTESGFSAAIERELRLLARSYSPPAVAQGLLFGYTGRFLSAVDPATGEMLWRSREPGDGFLVVIEDQLAVLTKEGDLHLGGASRTAWEETARLELFEDLAWTPPAVVGSSLYVRSLGAIARVDLVRTTEAASAAAIPLPAALVPLTEALAKARAEGGDTAAALTRFLAGKSLPLVDGDQVTFVYRGRGQDVAVAGDMIGMRREEPMHRLADTDLWWWPTTLDRRARVSYTFLVDNEPQPDPSHARRVASTVLGPDLNWQRGAGLTMSWFAMPDWPGHQLPASPARGLLERFEVAVANPGGAAGETVPVGLTAWLPPGYAEGTGRYPIAYVLDRRALEHGAWRETLDRVVGRTVAPMIVVFVAPPPVDEFEAAFVATVMPEVERRLRVKPGREARALVAMGFGGHAALLLTLQQPTLFSGLGIQSYYGLESMMTEVEQALAAAKPTESPLRIYLEWGRWDLRSPHEAMDMRASSQWLDRQLRARGYSPRGGEVLDSTDFASWRNRTDVLLESLFPLGPDEPASFAVWAAPP
jgi:outer membrane protein assembly factor BamB